MASINSQQRTICLSDLPIGSLAHAASYLALPSRALFAVALDSREEGSNSAIVGKQVDILDFGDIEKDLAAKLSDEDIRDVLLCIDSQNNLKKLRLTNCINITGAGLDPLRGSTIIEIIDLSLAGDHESPHLDPEPPISYYDVLPILDSIIQRGEGCALNFFLPPKVWRNELESDFHAFLIRYNQMLISRSPSCTKCNCNLQFEQYDTCYGCLRNFCADCDEDGSTYCVTVCDTCERHYCSQCQIMKICGEEGCGQMHCVGCMKFKRCYGCRTHLCIHCNFGHCDGDCVWCESCLWQNSSLKCDFCSTQYVSLVLNPMQIIVLGTAEVVKYVFVVSAKWSSVN